MSSGLTFGKAAAAIATASLVSSAAPASADDEASHAIYEKPPAAEAKAERRAQFGVRLGLGIGKLHYTGSSYYYDYAYDAKLSVFVSGAARIPLTGNTTGELALAPELGFTQMGYTYGYDGYEISLNLNYLVAPILLEYAFDAGSFAPYLTAGPQLAFRVKATAKVDFPGGSQSEDVTQEISPLDAGIAAGMGGRFHAGPVSAEVFFRFYQGLVDVEADSAGDGKSRNRQFVIGAGVLF